MAVSTPDAIPQLQKISDSKVLVAGAGEIGCKVLENLAMNGFEDIEIIDLDTIDVNNPQFPFHSEKSKADVARENVLKMNPNVNIFATKSHDNITIPFYGVGFFQKFDLVINALDNRQSRMFVNRMCLIANVPMIGGDTIFDEGKKQLIKMAKTKFPEDINQNKPSAQIDCVVWAEDFNNRLGPDDDEEVLLLLQNLHIPEDTSTTNSIVTQCQNIVKNHLIVIKRKAIVVSSNERRNFITVCAFLRAKKFDIVTSYNEIQLLVKIRLSTDGDTSISAEIVLMQAYNVLLERNDLCKSNLELLTLGFIAPPCGVLAEDWITSDFLKTLQPIDGLDQNTWIANKTKEFYEPIEQLFGLLRKEEKENGVRYCLHGCEPPDYMNDAMEWIREQLNDPSIFPNKSEGLLPKNFFEITKTINKQYFRVYSYVYRHHSCTVKDLDILNHVNTGFIQLIAFVKEFNLIDEHNLAPLKDLIDALYAKLDDIKRPSEQ